MSLVPDCRCQRRISKGARMAHEGREGKARPERELSVR
ncbi:hypothetical protein CHCC20331_0087 [Bacillus paralicheniformis]|nr:hypothetical protein CHCC5021_1337 [Bacillus paralicheniformis]TWK88469.1 hypothetical protein CHCC20331_0087 [Bacillus paralicheniformis]TWL02697.1 hypothetical protein CHCC19468_2848 [Bacillus paralicheniformis]TWL13016.1 hypothetical protein CHCC19467_1710 [Bacillus paralicheniformis]TWL37613.1 hypothetical protein CHCC15337_3448 [Bacillus paralicheniformis]